MFGKAFPLFRLFGFNVKADPSWLVVVALIIWTLARNTFPEQAPGLSDGTYWMMGLLGAIGLFGSIVLHELAHSLVARRFAIPIRGITLFIFGGVAELSDEPPTAKAEFWVAIAGPLMSAAIAAVSFGLWWIGSQAGGPEWAVALLLYLGSINAILVAFNLIPAFPLDGGRVLRSALWAWKKNLRWATKITATIGAAFGLILVGLGILALLNGQLIAGLWNILIGLFLRGAAGASYQQLLIRRALEGEPVSRFMTSHPVTVPRDLTLREFVDDYAYRHHFKLYPVVDGDRLVGCLETERLREISADQWSVTSVADVLRPLTPINTIAPNRDAMHALSRMQRHGLGRLMVVENGHLAGIFSMKDVMKLMALRVEFNDIDPDEHTAVEVGTITPVAEKR